MSPSLSTTVQPFLLHNSHNTTIVMLLVALPLRSHRNEHPPTSEDVKAALNERTNWTIEMLRNVPYERAENMGYATFAIVIAIPDVGIIIIRVVGIIVVSGPPWLAFCLIFFSAAPTIILPLLIHLVKTFRIRIHQPTVDQGEIERGEVVEN
ncbi:hypothetical protein BU15DRAFT_67745 [Melanogaster broomeanus]|nr:hypothetical protein BU15DRAFT_67745 [Melanogaster broomeanus]